MLHTCVKFVENGIQELKKINEKNIFINIMKDLKSYIVETKGEHDNSKVYDDLYGDVEKHLKKWGAGPVYGWKGDNGICFSVSKGKNVEKDDWITIVYNKQYDDLLITLSKFGTDDIDDAKAYEDNVYAGQEPEVIDDLLNKKK